MIKYAFFTPGCLGTCWYGKYHYLEPFTGCQYDCAYCYAKVRSEVISRLADIGTAFSQPEIGMPQENALEAMRRELAENSNIKIVKLSRYTDIFTKKFVENGFSHKVLQMLVKTPQITRIIITTKAAPDENILKLIIDNPDKFSYNLSIKPKNGIYLEENLPPRNVRLSCAAACSKAGVLTTVHIDPVVHGPDDSGEALNSFCGEIKEYGLSRVMFSYMLFEDKIAANVTNKIGVEDFEKIRINYNIDRTEILPNQEEIKYFILKPGIKIKSIEKIAGILKHHGLDFVVCGLKTGKGNIEEIKKCCPVCDGKFYA